MDKSEIIKKIDHILKLTNGLYARQKMIELMRDVCQLTAGARLPNIPVIGLTAEQTYGWNRAKEDSYARTEALLGSESVS